MKILTDAFMNQATVARRPEPEAVPVQILTQKMIDTRDPDWKDHSDSWNARIAKLLKVKK